MEVAISLLGLALTTLGAVFAYIWRSNGLLQRSMMAALERIQQGQERMEQGQREIAHLVEQNQQVLHQLLQENRQAFQEVLQENRQAFQQILLDGRQTREALQAAVEGIQELLRRSASAS